MGFHIDACLPCHPQGIDWPDEGGKTHRLKVTAIHYRPEAAGHLYR